MIDVSIPNVLGKNIRHFSHEINQLYHPTSIIEQDSEDLIYSFNTINLTKFGPILLKEWFYMIKKGGYLIIDYVPNTLCDFKNLNDQMLNLWERDFKVFYHGSLEKFQMEDMSDANLVTKIKVINNSIHPSEKHLRFVCKKITSTKKSGDNIKSWSFGIITNGKRDEWVNQVIKSINQQSIPNYEIIVCGTYDIKQDKNLKYIPFNEHDAKGWITKKKNLIVKNAKYNNLCILHDRMILNKDWYTGMKKWGNCFENLGCRQLYEGKRINDWLTTVFDIFRNGKKVFWFNVYIDYRDWYPSVWFLGQMNICKKWLLLKNGVSWNEDLFWGEKEDFDFSSQLNRAGLIHRLNPFSSTSTLLDKYLRPTFAVYNTKSIHPRINIWDSYSLMKIVVYLLIIMLDFLGLNVSLTRIEGIRNKIYGFFVNKKFLL